MPNAPTLPATPRKGEDPANLVPGALPVESVGPTTPIVPPSSIKDEDSSALLDLMDRLHLQEHQAF